MVILHMQENAPFLLSGADVRSAVDLIEARPYPVTLAARISSIVHNALAAQAGERKDPLSVAELAMLTHVLVYLPATPYAGRIERGSAILAADYPLDHDGKFLVYYEGNVYKSAGMQFFEERCLHAAARLRQRYPTVARMRADPADFIQVGIYSLDTREVTISAKHHEWFAAWCGWESWEAHDPRELQGVVR
jgi:hypothetical protein